VGKVTIAEAENAIRIVKELASKGTKVLGDLPERVAGQIRIEVPLYAVGGFHGAERYDSIDPQKIPIEIVGYWVAGVKFPHNVTDYMHEHTSVPEGHVSRAIYHRRRTRGGKLDSHVIYLRSRDIVVIPIKEAQDMYGYNTKNDVRKRY